MKNYNCKYQIYRNSNLIAKSECKKCTADVINNPNCPSYEPINIRDFEEMEERCFMVVSKLEDLLK